MTVPADEAEMTNGRPYARLVVATSVAVRVAKLSRSINDDAFNELREDQFKSRSLAWPSPPPKSPLRARLRRISTSFLPHRQFGFSRLEAPRPAGRVLSRGAGLPARYRSASPVPLTLAATPPDARLRATPLPVPPARPRWALVVFPGCRCGADGLDDCGIGERGRIAQGRPVRNVPKQPSHNLARTGFR